MIASKHFTASLNINMAKEIAKTVTGAASDPVLDLRVYQSR